VGGGGGRRRIEGRVGEWNGEQVGQEQISQPIRPSHGRPHGL
jgi:hypothetical protein